MTRAEYDAYVAAYKRGTEGFEILASREDDDGEPWFSWAPCDVCNRKLGGDRYAYAMCNPGPDSGEPIEVDICTDCVYFAAYGELDDTTMMEVEKDDEQIAAVIRTEQKRWRATVRWFAEHAGGVVGRCWQGALHLARAEREAESREWRFEWHADIDGDLGDHEYWCGGPRRARHEGVREDGYCDHAIEFAEVYDEKGQHRASLGGIIDATDDYRRVIEAELAAEALAEEEGTRTAIAG